MFQGRAQLFRRLAALSGAGISIPEALRKVLASTSGRQRRALEAAIAVYDRGGDSRDALTSSEAFNPFERELLLGGEQAARLPEAFAKLADISEARNKTRIGAALALAYPTLIIHLACILPNAATLVQKGVGAFAWQCTKQLGALYLLALGPFALLWLARRSEGLRRGLDGLALRLPLLGGYLLKRETSYATLVLGHLYSSGTSLLPATEQVGRLSTNLALREAWLRVHDQLHGNATLTEALAAEPLIPASVTDLVATGEASGQLDEMLLAASRDLESSAATQLKLIIGALTGLVFMLAVGLVVWRILSFYIGYFEQLNKF